MSFFADAYDTVRLPIAGDGYGLRRAQLGAAHAVASHFTVRRDPALVSMPTGTGKTAVLMLSAFLLRASRVLVLTPSRLVRDQIVEDFSSLGTLRRLGALPADGPLPAVREVDARIAEPAGWEALREADVVVAIPASVSPLIEGVAAPPPDLFDLVLVDEAHHSAADTWDAVLDAFPRARRVLFTATPFRRDRREIKGAFVYEFPLKEAYADGVFGKIRFAEVRPADGEPSDVAIARATAAAFAADAAAGFDHLVVVRTDLKTRAKQLQEVYERHTPLRLRTIHSGLGFRHVKSVVRKLRDKELDGVICVDMLGEGFDLPNLKIAAVHAPHRSLAVTLQFVGRFARTGAAGIGEAKFLAVRSEIEIEETKLCQEGAVWQEIVTGLSGVRIGKERETRERLATFAPPSVTRFETADVSLYSLRPFCHAKIFQVSGPVHIASPLRLPAPSEVVFHQVSPDLSAAVVITRDAVRPRWSDVEFVQDVSHDLFLVHFDADRRLLFIVASRREESLYDAIADGYAPTHAGLPMPRIDRVLRTVDRPTFFNIGMRNRQASRQTETYRTVAGARADAAVSETDGRLYDRGHVFGRGDTADGPETIGYSSLSKVWSNRYLQIPQCVAWCQRLAEQIGTDGSVVTRSGLDHLCVGEEILRFPFGPIAADWPEEIYKKVPQVTARDPRGEVVVEDAVDLDLVVDPTRCGDHEIGVRVVGRAVNLSLTFRLSPRPYCEPAIPNDGGAMIHLHREGVPLVEYLNRAGLHFYFADLSRVFRNQRFPHRHEDPPPFDVDRIETIDWSAAGVDIRCEFGPATPRGCSIHEHLGRRLCAEPFDVVFYDHRTGEVADYLTLRDGDAEIEVGLYHCKKSGGEDAGHRLGDLYEVCGQVVKCQAWMGDAVRLLQTVERRAAGGSTFAKGDLPRARALLGDERKRLRYQVTLVQPGLSKAKLKEDGAFVLAAAADYLRHMRDDALRVFASA